MMELLYADNRILVCVKPAGALSTDGPGGVPELARLALGEPAADIRTVHRLDRVVGGVMLLARGKDTASLLGKQVMDGRFAKEYRAVVHGVPAAARGTFSDLLRRDKRECKTYVADGPGKGVQEAVLDYALLDSREGLSYVSVTLRTGRTHQIRCQFSARGLPLVGDRKYGTLSDAETPIALWSHALAFDHPETGKRMRFALPPPEIYPWKLFE